MKQADSNDLDFLRTASVDAVLQQPTAWQLLGLDGVFGSILQRRRIFTLIEVHDGLRRAIGHNPPLLKKEDLIAQGANLR